MPGPLLPPHPAPPIPAPMGRRLFAKMLDGLMGLGVSFVLSRIIFAVIGEDDFQRQYHKQTGWELAQLYASIYWPVVAAAGGWMVMYGVVQSLLLAFTGQSLGKRMMKLKVVNAADGAPATINQAVFLRYWTPHFLYVNPLMFLGPITLLLDGAWIFSEQQQCMHDVLAGTQVVTID